MNEFQDDAGQSTAVLDDCAEASNTGRNLSANHRAISKASWRPRWIVLNGVGLTISDGSFVVLFRTVDGSWRPGNWIPPKVALKISELLVHGVAGLGH
jgi:hypothetical protein